MLQQAGHDVIVSGDLPPLDAVTLRALRLIILDLTLTDRRALDVLRSLCVDGVAIPVIAIAGVDDDPLLVVHAMLSTRDTPVRLEDTPSYAASRWGEAVIGLVRADRDVRTLDEWGRAIGASAGTLPRSGWARFRRITSGKCCGCSPATTTGRVSADAGVTPRTGRSRWPRRR